MSSLFKSIVILALFWVIPVHADIRVLFEFDSTGHSVHRVFELPATGRFGSGSAPVDTDKVVPSNSARQTVIARGRSVIQASSETSLLHYSAEDYSPGYSILLWYDQNGEFIAKTSAPDPRVARAPSHISGIGHYKTSLASGGWIATGPDAAYQVALILPSSDSLGLPEEHWNLLLHRD